MTINLTGLTSTLRPTELANVLAFHEKHAEPIIVVGPPGVGKSDQVRQVSAAHDRAVVYFDASTADPTDIPGIPFPVRVHESPEDTVGRLICERAVFKKFISNNAITFFADETFQGSPAVLNSLAPVFLEKRLGDMALDPNTWVVGATNRPQDKAGTSRPPSHLPNRVTIVETAFQVDDTRSYWLDHDMPMELLGFAKYDEESIFNFDPNRLVNATPRQWMWIGKHFDELMHLSRAARLAIMGGRVTEGIAAKFEGFCDLFASLPSIEMALMNPETIPMPERLDVRYAFATALSNAATKDNFDRIHLLEQRFERNIGVMLVNDAQRKRPEIKQTKAFVSWAIRNADVLL